MRYLRVKKWEEFQHYKDRNPPWIKLHRAVLDDYEFARLHDASKAHLMLIWLFASQHDGKIPDDPDFLKDKLSLKKPPDLKLFIDQGLLIPEQVASKPLQSSASNTLSLARSRESEESTTTTEAEPIASSDESLSAADPHEGKNGTSKVFVIGIPLNDGSEYPITAETVTEFEQLYPALDITQTLREIRGWNISHPKRRKTKSGVLAHITSWLAKEQNKAP